MSPRARLARWCTDAALNLAVFRLTVGLVVLGVQDIHALAAGAARLPLALRTAPLGWAPVMRAVPLSPTVVDVLRVVLNLAALTGALGLGARLSFTVVTLTGLFFWAHAMTLGSAIHLHHLLWFSALLAVSPCGDALSLDRRLFRPQTPVPADHPAYGIPLRTAALLVGAIYFFPGFWKLATSGPAWIFSDNLLHHLRAKWTQLDGFTPLLRVDRHAWLCRAGALATVLFELSFGLLVVSRRTRPWAAALALLFHQATDWFMGLRYPSLWCCYTVFIDWRGLAARFYPVSETPVRQRDLRAQAVVSAALLAGAVGFGAAGESDAWPFACYPKFDRLGPTTLPGLGVALVYPGGERAVPVRAMFPEGRTQRYWALSWSLLGAHRTERASVRRFTALWSTLAVRPGVRAMLPGALAVRFYRETLGTDPDRRADPPIARVLLAELTFRDARR